MVFCLLQWDRYHSESLNDCLNYRTIAVCAVLYLHIVNNWFHLELRERWFWRVWWEETRFSAGTDFDTTPVTWGRWRGRTRPLPVWLHDGRCASLLLQPLHSDFSIHFRAIRLYCCLNTRASGPALFEMFPPPACFSVRGDENWGFCQWGTSLSLINGPPKDSRLIMRTPADNMEEGVFIIIWPQGNIGRLSSCLAGERLIARRHLSDWLFWMKYELIGRRANIDFHSLLLSAPLCYRLTAPH